MTLDFVVGESRVVRMMRANGLLLRAMCVSSVLGLGLGTTSVAPAEDLFDVTSIPSAGRAVAARIADFDGDGRADLFAVSIEGMPPNEQRIVRVFLQQTDGTLPTSPSHFVPLPRWSGVYDVADLLPWPGVEMVLLRPGGVTLLSLSDGSGRQKDLPLPGGGSVATAEDERGFEPVKLVYYDLAAKPVLLVPKFGGLIAMHADGSVIANLIAARRANYYVVPTDGFVAAESDIQLFIDVPKVATGDVNGDGRVDILSTTRHEIRVYLMQEDGSFADEPSRTLALGMVTRRDHIRGSGGVTCEFNDIDLDGKLDLLVTHVEGSITDATTTTYVFVNREGQWALDKPDSTFSSDVALASNKLVDLDGDGKPELLRIQIRFSVLEFVELLLTRELDAVIAFHGQSETAGFSKKPILTRSLSVPFRFDTFRVKGFVPTIVSDLNADGYVDLLASGEGDVVEVFLGGGKDVLAKRSVSQDMPTAGVISFADFNSDGLPDFVLFDPHNFDVPIQVAVNKGALKGTPPQLRARP